MALQPLCTSALVESTSLQSHLMTSTDSIDLLLKHGELPLQAVLHLSIASMTGDLLDFGLPSINLLTELVGTSTRLLHVTDHLSKKSIEMYSHQKLESFLSVSLEQGLSVKLV